MLEAGIAFGIFALMALTAVVSQSFNWLSLLKLGAGTLLSGTLLSLGTGGMYHVRLAQSAACRAGRVPKWWWTPTRLHSLLTPRERRDVLPWFWAGGLSFCLVVLGAVWAVLAVSRMTNL